MTPDPGLVARISEGRALLDGVITAVGRSDVTVVAVTKGFGPEVAVAAAAAGFGDLGENYAQEVVAKAPVVADVVGEVRWHFLGRLQRNKVRLLAPHVHLWHSVDRASLVDEVARRAPEARICIQVDLAGLPDRGGCSWDEVEALVERARDGGLQPVGLMGVAPPGPPEAARPVFRRLVHTAGELALPIRSIGMTNDLQVALEEGATHVRVGRMLFGERPPRGD